MPASFTTEIDFQSPTWNRDTWARIQGNVDGESQKFTAFRGVVTGHRPGKKALELFGFEGHLCTRLRRLEDGSYRRLTRETVLFRDLRSQELLTHWDNPFTAERVPVVPVRMDPFNYTISDMLTVITDTASPFGTDPQMRRVPLVFPWEQLGPDKLALATDIHLSYENPLPPARWPVESSGPLVQISEMMRFFVDREDVENPELSSVNFVGSWTRQLPWLPWMRMGKMDGHVLFVGTMNSADDDSVIADDVRAVCERDAPQFLSAPDDDYGPSLSSLEIYARDQLPG